MEGVSAAVSNVLDDDDLLAEVLLRVAFPTTLVRAALVCKRWYHHASDHEFLRGFRRLHPPRLLGYYRNGRFIPMLPQPPELAAVVRRVASYSLSGAEDDTRVVIKNCRNGSVYALLYKQRSGVCVDRVHRPLCQDKAMVAAPPLSRLLHFTLARRILSKEDERGGLSYVCLAVEGLGATTYFTAYVLQHGVWCKRMSVAVELPGSWSRLQAVLVGNKIYMMATVKDIIVFDLTASSTSTIQLPQGVEYICSDIMLSRADDASGVYLIQVDVELRIWLHRRDNWLLVDTICFREMVANLRMSDCTVVDEHSADVRISQVGDNAEFVFLKMGRCTLYLDIKGRTLRKVHERTEHDRSLEDIYPFMMSWPPTFPTLKDDFARQVPLSFARHILKFQAMSDDCVEWLKYLKAWVGRRQDASPN